MTGPTIRKSTKKPAQKLVAGKSAKKKPAKKKTASSATARKSATKTTATQSAKGTKKAVSGPVSVKSREPRKAAVPPSDPVSASQEIDAKINALGDWRGETLARVRALIHHADPDVVEEIKWRKPSNPSGVPVWSRGGIICTGETYKDKVKLTFDKGASLPDPAGLFNASLDGKARRAIDLREGDKIDERAFKALVREAVALNAPSGARQKKK